MDPKEVTGSDSVDFATCQVCAKHADGYCRECHQFLCQNCFEIHKKFGSNKTHKLLKLDEVTTTSIHVMKEMTTCMAHGESLRIFCETCQELICHSCIDSNFHKGHEYDTINDCYHKHHLMLMTSLNAIEKKFNDATAKMAALKNQAQEIRDHGRQVKEEIHLISEKMIDEIRQSEEILKREVDTGTDYKLQVVSSQTELAENSISQLRKCIENVKQNLELYNSQQVLSLKKQMMEQMDGLMEEINVDDYELIEECDIELIRKREADQLHIGIISCSSAVHRSKVKINSHQATFEDKSILIPFLIELPNFSPLVVPLSSLSCSVTSTIKPINTTVTTTDHPGVYRIHCTPVSRGKYQINVQVNNVRLESVSLTVPLNHHVDTITSIHTIERLNGPFGVAINKDGHVVITEYNSNSVMILDREGKKIKSFGNIKFVHPRGIAITPDNDILITDSHKIQKISMDGRLIASVGREGTKPLEFKHPCGITISPITGQIYVVDSFNHRVQVLNSDLTFSFSFGGEGLGKGQFQYPSFIAIDSQGMIYISDKHNNRINKLTADGKFVTSFGSSGPGHLQHPQGLAVANNLLYIAESDAHRVSIYTINGGFVRSFGSKGTFKDQLKKPRGVTIDDEGHLYVCNYLNNKLIVY